MPVIRTRAFMTFLSLLIGLWMVNPAQAAQRKRIHKAPVKQEQPAPPAPAPAPVVPVELTLQQKPAVPPQVTYNNGQLTIMAENSTIGDILRAVHTQTGATVDIPSNATERVVSHVGPGPARDVLATLLNGSDYNYVLLGTVKDPHAVQRVILTPKSPGAANVMASNQNNQPAMQLPYPVTRQTGNDTAESDSNEADTAEEQADQAEEQPVAGQQPNGQPGIKTPEQLLQELQRQQQIQQQQQQGSQGMQQPGQVPELSHPPPD